MTGVEKKLQEIKYRQTIGYHVDEVAIYDISWLVGEHERLSAAIHQLHECDKLNPPDRRCVACESLSGSVQEKET